MEENTELQKEENVTPETVETPAEEIEEPIPPLHEQTVLGVPRFSFWGILFGYGLSLIHI